MKSRLGISENISRARSDGPRLTTAEKMVPFKVSVLGFQNSHATPTESFHILHVTITHDTYGVLVEISFFL